MILIILYCIPYNPQPIFFTSLFNLFHGVWTFNSVWSIRVQKWPQSIPKYIQMLSFRSAWRQRSYQAYLIGVFHPDGMDLIHNRLSYLANTNPRVVVQLYHCKAICDLMKWWSQRVWQVFRVFGVFTVSIWLITFNNVIFVKRGNRTVHCNLVCRQCLIKTATLLLTPTMFL